MLDVFIKVVECRRVHQVCPSEGCESTPSLPTITTWVNFNLTGDRKLEDGDVKKNLWSLFSLAAISFFRRWPSGLFGRW